MADTLALENLYNNVVARFTAEGTSCSNSFGWREPDKQMTASRIVWVPGDPSGNAGQDGPARNPGNNPRSLGTLNELFHVIISSNDPTDPTNELKQYKATRLLRDAWHRAVYLAARGTFAIQSEAWLIDKKVARFGTALRIVVAIQSMIPDEPLETAPVDTVADITVDDLDQTETLTVSATDTP